MQVILANPRGFCAGVERAIAIVERAIEILGAPIYVRHEVVHNQFVCDDLRAKGAIFIDELAQAPAGSTSSSVPTASPGRFAKRPQDSASRSSMPPARWSPRCTSKSRRCAGQAARS
jgi:hypothetical protein